ncbi:hypothetical protein COP2_041528 [Malus domestica]
MPSILGVEAHFFFIAQLQVSNLHSRPTVSTCSTLYYVLALQTHQTPDPEFGSRSLTTAALRRAPMSADLACTLLSRYTITLSTPPES